MSTAEITPKAPGGVEYQGNRRDTCYELGICADGLTDAQAAVAWRSLAGSLERMGEKDVPKFLDLLASINAAVIVAKNRNS
jgi:hypothetical protein